MTESSVAAVTEWVIALLQCAPSGATATLHECMKVGDSDANIGVFDDAGHEHRCGSEQYEDYYLVALRRLVASEAVEPVCGGDQQRAAWACWMSGDPLHAASRRAVIDIELRYVEQEGEEEELIPVQSAGAYLLGILRQEDSVPYSRFYARDVDPKSLAAATKLSEDHAHVLIEYAAFQLEEAGIIAFTQLPSKLIDGENDYLIALTEQGKAFLTSEKGFEYRDMDF